MHLKIKCQDDLVTIKWDEIFKYAQNWFGEYSEDNERFMEHASFPKMTKEQAKASCTSLIIGQVMFACIKHSTEQRHAINKNLVNKGIINTAIGVLSLELLKYNLKTLLKHYEKGKEVIEVEHFINGLSGQRKYINEIIDKTLRDIEIKRQKLEETQK